MTIQWTSGVEGLIKQKFELQSAFAMYWLRHTMVTRTESKAHPQTSTRSKAHLQTSTRSKAHLQTSTRSKAHLQTSTRS